MALRLLPFRQYDEQDVVNMFALKSDQALPSTTGDGNGSNGVFVKIADGNFDQEVIEYTSNSYLGNQAYPHVGAGMYPTNPLEIEAAASGNIPLGLTLNQTAKADENGEKLLYNQTKKEELQAVLPGQSVPVATKGIFTLSSDTFAGGVTLANFSVGGGFEVAGTTGTIGPVADAIGTASIGMVLGTGSRSSSTVTDQFAGDYIIVKLG